MPSPIWQIDFNDTAKADLLSFDKPIRHRVLSFFEDRVAKHPDPAQLAETLTGQYKGLHRFRVGDYRVVCYISKRRLTVPALFADDRNAVYKRNVPEYDTDEQLAAADLKAGQRPEKAQE